jgi:diacylglycerol kinase (ATP)
MEDKGKRMKPKYSIFKNFSYAREGFIEVFKKERAFQIEVFFVVLFSIVAFMLPYPLWAKIFLIASMSVVLFVELLNSAIERVVDMITDEYDELAKYAKDAAAAAVMISIFFSVLVWLGFIIYFWR